jgi:K+-transporting ATPase KdpF subunit
MDRRHGGVLGRDVLVRGWPAQAGNAAKGTLMISLEVLYGFGGLIAVLLFAYLVFALICAEEF